MAISHNDDWMESPYPELYVLLYQLLGTAVRGETQVSFSPCLCGFPEAPGWPICDRGC